MNAFSAISERHIHLLPAQAQELVKLLGFSGALDLVSKLGGVTFPVAKRMTKVGEARFKILSEAVGDEAAEKITARYGGTRLYIPNCKDVLRRVRNIAMVEEYDKRLKAGESSKAIVFDLVLRYRLADRVIWDIVNKTCPEQWEDSSFSQKQQQLNLLGDI